METALCSKRSEMDALGLALSEAEGEMLALGLALAAGGMLLTGLAGSFATAAAWRALTGAGSGASNVPVMGLLAAWFVQRRRGLAAGIAVTGSSLALIVLGPLVPHLIAAYGGNGWRVCWCLDYLSLRQVGFSCSSCQLDEVFAFVLR
jgi:MFS family permease